MKRLRYQFYLPRDARIAIAAAALLALGAGAFDRGWVASAIILILLAVGLLGAFYAFVVRPARLPKRAVLNIRLADNLREIGPHSPLDQLRSRGAPNLFELRRALEGAANDPALKAVLVEIAAPALGLATAQELHDLLRAATQRGKRVIALLSGDNATLRDYYVACGASEIIANPDTAFLMLGISAGSVFLKEALAKLGIEAQTLQWKEYKGAAETFSRDSMSPALRESLDAILSDWKAALTAAIATARKLPPAQVESLIAAGFMSADAGVAANLLDRTGYLDDLRRDFDPELKDDPFVTVSHYLRHLAYRREGPRGARIALIHGLGPVVAGEGPLAGEFISGERVAGEFRRAARDEEIRAIVFRINSPGGSAVGSDLVWRAVREAREHNKPVIVSMGDVAGSGGYYVAMAADAIVAEPTTITGSIGVVYTKFSLPALLARLGVNFDSVKTDPVSDALSPARAMTEAELAQLNQMVGQLYANFTAKVAEGRKLPPDAAEDVARGRVWSGVAAKARGLVDELGGMDQAVALARAKAGLSPGEPHELYLYPPPNFFSSLGLNALRSQALPLDKLASALGIPSRWVPALTELLTRRSGVLLLTEFFG